MAVKIASSGTINLELTEKDAPARGAPKLQIGSESSKHLDCFGKEGLGRRSGTHAKCT